MLRLQSGQNLFVRERFLFISKRRKYWKIIGVIKWISHEKVWGIGCKGERAFLTFTRKQLTLLNICIPSLIVSKLFFCLFVHYSSQQASWFCPLSFRLAKNLLEIDLQLFLEGYGHIRGCVADVCVHTCVGVNSYVCPRMWRSEINIKYFLQRRSFTGSRVLLTWRG